MEEKVTIKRQPRSAKFKLKVALEAAQEKETLNQIANKYGLNPGQVSQWKRHLQSQGEQIFSHGSQPNQKEQEKKEAELYEQIGRLKMELEWLKKKVSAVS